MASTVIDPCSLVAPASVAASIRSMRTAPLTRSSMFLPATSAKLRSSRTSVSPPVRMAMAPSLAVTDSITRPSDSLMRILPALLELALMLATTVLSRMAPLVRTSRWSPIKTEAPSISTDAAVTLMSPPVVASALTMPPKTLRLPLTSISTLAAGLKPLRPPTKPLRVKSLVPVTLASVTLMSRRARSSKLLAGSAGACTVMKPVC